MGIYLQLPVDQGKAEWLEDNAGAQPFGGESFEQVPSGRLLVIVAARPGHDAAAVIYDKKEWELKTRLSREGEMPNRMLVVDRVKALELEPAGRLAEELSGRPMPAPVSRRAPRGAMGVVSRLRRR